MESLEKMSIVLIDIKSKIKQYAKNDTLTLNLNDLKCFYNLKKIDANSFEKNMMKRILSNDNLDLSFIEDNIKFYIKFYENYQNRLELVNKSAIINNYFAYDKRKINEAYKELKLASLKYEEIHNKIESNLYFKSINEVDLNLLHNQVQLAKDERKKANEEYTTIYNFYNRKYEEYSLLTFFDFIDIYNNFKEIIELINSYKTKNSRFFKNSNMIFDFERIGIIYRLGKPFFNFDITEEELAKRLSLEIVTPKKKIRRGSAEKFSYLVEKVLKTLSISIDKKKEWERIFTKASCLNLETFRKGNKAENAEDFLKEINNSLKHYMI